MEINIHVPWQWTSTYPFFFFRGGGGRGGRAGCERGVVGGKREIKGSNPLSNDLRRPSPRGLRRNSLLLYVYSW